jgi:hypothetical protein
MNTVLLLGSRAAAFSRWMRCAGALLLFFSFWVGNVSAQTETGQIAGTVSDQSGAVISGASVTAISAGGLKRESTTNENGNYTITNLQPGVYEVKVEKDGFMGLTQRVQVTVGSRAAFDATLGVTTATDVVEISGAEGIQINTQTQELKSVVSEKLVKELPSINRNPYDFVATSGNVAADADSGRGTGFSINGQRSASTNVLLDGSDNNDAFVAGVGQNVPLDSVGEFSIITNNFGAEYGRASGGVVNLVTKSGTNQFHGTVYEFNRLSKLAANTYDNNSRNLPRGVFTRNQFGYSLGGPVIKDKILFFSSAEFIRIRSSRVQTFIVPTPQLIAAASPATQAFFQNFPLTSGINGRTFSRSSPEFQRLVSNNVITGAFATAFPVGGTTPLFGEANTVVPVDAGGGTPGNTSLTVNRVDYNVNDKASFYVRYATEKTNQANEVSPYQGFNTQTSVFNNNILGSFTYTFSPKFTTQSKVVYNRLNANQPLGANPSGPTLFMNQSGVNTLNGNTIVFPGYSAQTPGNAIPFGGPQNVIQFFQDATYVLDRHEFRFGGSFYRLMDNRTFGAFQNAVQALSAQNNPTNSLNNFINGTATVFQVAIDPQGNFPLSRVTLPATPPSFTRNNRFNEFSLYFSDGFRLSNRIRLNLGLRYEFYGVQKNKDQNLDSNFYFGGDGGVTPQNVATGVVDRAPNRDGIARPDRNNFAPRVGVAWDVFGNGKLSLRGGYGISYERNFGNVTFNIIQNPPNYAVVQLQNNPITTNPVGPFGGTGSITLPPTTLRTVDPNIKTAYAQSYNVAAEYQLFRNSVVAVEYAGSRGSRLYSISNINRNFSNVLIGGDGSARLNPQYSNINFRDDNGSSNYNSLNLRFQTIEIPKTGLSVIANYTYSHAIDNLSSTFSEGTVGNYGLGFVDPFNPNLDRGTADFDARHRFTLSGVWDIPFAKQTSGIGKKILDGFSVSYLFTARTGNPFTLYDCTNGFTICPRASLTSNVRRSGADNPQLVGDNTFNFIDYSTLNATAGGFANPVTGTSEFGPFPSNMLGRGAFVAPGRYNLDMVVAKRIPINERIALQFRSEFFNVFNHANLSIDPTTLDVSSGTFVQANKGQFASDRRQVQFALKVIF